jgi:hypothetical protein
MSDVCTNQFAGRRPEPLSKNKKDAGFNPAPTAYCFLSMAYVISDSSATIYDGLRFSILRLSSIKGMPERL